MKPDDLSVMLKRVKTGDELARERLITHYKPYIINVAGQITHKYVSWSEEEASIALLAFNKAIDTFDPSAGRQFLNYVYLLINRDLIDYYRKEKKETHSSLDLTNDNDTSLLINEHEQSIEQFEKQVQTSELVEEILEFDAALREFQITFEELEHYSPKHSDTRDTLFVLASVIANDVECVETLRKKKKLPISMIAKKYEYKKKMLERHRKYLITLVVLYQNPQWEQLSQFIKKEGSR
ncbi:sigma-70 family RNA polymerase sigma factor [Halalkalibacter akibai]|uniref:RNA polymerase sigma factor SigI n=1 Tax=Halalkalibacter akibai (strain ATCC 43226 / DSM 21942 / CIP 109018 / JCM 9157 / 1139) TaxID=1236973 RepID=W4QT72_HALA3|nr:sigma-70 family RNA polymerase sigma factor [Halalkalibacter akibai]GAE34833.1 sigma factor SgiI [Halalkalibacter akibai JCM 9157]